MSKLLAACCVLALGSGCSYGVAALTKGPCSRQPAHADTGVAIGTGLVAATLIVFGAAVSDDHGENSISNAISRAVILMGVSVAVVTAGFTASALYGYEHDSCSP